MSSGGGGQTSDPNAGIGSGVASGAAAGSAAGPWGALAGATIGLMSGISQANAAKVRGTWEKERAKTNAMLIDMQKTDILEQAEVEASEYEKEVSQMLGAQDAAFAAQGIDINTGTAQEIKNQTRELGDQDIKAIKNNAWKQAWGLEFEMEAELERGKFAQKTADTQAKQQIISSGISAVNTGLKFYNS